MLIIPLKEIVLGDWAVLGSNDWIKRGEKRWNPGFTAEGTFLSRRLLSHRFITLWSTFRNTHFGCIFFYCISIKCFSANLIAFLGAQNPSQSWHFHPFGWNDSFPAHHFSLILPTQFFLLHSAPERWIPLEESLGSGAKTATLSTLYQTGVKSTNRLLWPNVIKLHQGWVQFTVLSVCGSVCGSGVGCSASSSEKQIIIIIMTWTEWKDVSVKRRPHSVLTAGGSVEMEDKTPPHIRSQCGVALQRRTTLPTECVSQHVLRVCVYDSFCYKQQSRLDQVFYQNKTLY